VNDLTYNHTSKILSPRMKVTELLTSFREKWEKTLLYEEKIANMQTNLMNIQEESRKWKDEQLAVTKQEETK